MPVPDAQPVRLFHGQTVRWSPGKTFPKSAMSFSQAYDDSQIVSELVCSK